MTPNADGVAPFGCGANRESDREAASFRVNSTNWKLGYADDRRGSLCEPHVGQTELASANAMHQFDPGDRNGGVPEAFEAEHDVHPRFDVAMIPVDAVLHTGKRVCLKGGIRTPAF
ncbi:hypothetical protein [Paraburkholderia sp. GAS32]|uniref:hypothetical protein n=1 Tax=Paraburkholderia sp. GAS32 TaxID=3035129 RepID=UPI003D1E236C